MEPVFNHAPRTFKLTLSEALFPYWTWITLLPEASAWYVAMCVACGVRVVGLFVLRVRVGLERMSDFGMGLSACAFTVERPRPGDQKPAVCSLQLDMQPMAAKFFYFLYLLSKSSSSTL